MSYSRWRVRVAAALWLPRHTYWPGPMMLAGVGWLSSEADVALGWRFALMLSVAAVLKGIGNVLNDIFDRKKDLITAPEMPIPSGLVSVRVAWLVAGTMLGAIVAATLLVAPRAVDALLGVAMIVVGVGLTVLYSKTKRFGLMGSAASATAVSLVPLYGWIVAPGSQWDQIALVLVATFVLELGGNQVAAARDLELDAQAGTRTLPVRIGARKALAFTSLCSSASAILILTLALQRPGGWASYVALPMLVVSQLFGWRALPGAVRAVERPGRVQRHADLLRYQRPTLFLPVVALTTVFSLPLALGVVASMLLLGGVHHRRYSEAVLQGGLRQRLADLDSLASRGRAGAPSPTGTTS